MTLPCLLHEAARRHPGAPALHAAGGAPVSFAALEARVAAAAAALQREGWAGQRVGLYLPTGEAYVVLLLALLRVQSVAVLLPTRTPPGGLPPLLARTACRHVVAAVPLSLPGVHVRLPTALPGAAEVAGPTHPAASPRLAPEQPATVVFTSGSTGTPKAALHTWGNHYWSAEGANQNLPLGPGDRWLLSLPLYHVGGLGIVFRCLMAGATVVLPSADGTLAAQCARTRPTHLSLVATQLRRLLDEGGGAPPAGLRAALLGGGPLPASLLEAAHARGWPLFTSYGLTEMASQVTTTPPGAPPHLLLSAGRVLPHRALRLAPSGTAAPPGAGEIQVRGRTLFAGYLDGDRLDPARTPDGWFATRDLGVIAEGGALRVVGRCDNQFVSGGENVQPEEVEAALLALPEVRQAVVVPVPDPLYGHRPVAFVDVEGEVVWEALPARLAATLPRFKIPDAFYAWPEEAAAAAMKVQRSAFARLARETPPRWRRR